MTVTVAELAARLEERNFHGIEKAIEKRSLNEEKWPILRDILFKETAKLEARRQGQDKTEEYLKAIDEFSNSLLFNTFIDKVVAPDAKVSEDEVRDYYQGHIEDFSSPAMYRLTGLAFAALNDAKAALKKLQKG